MIKVIALLKRKPGLTREEFANRWLNEHTKLSSKLPGLRGYRINIATDYQPDGTGVEPLYDGTAELWWDSFEEMDASFASEIGVRAGADADEFSSVRIHIYTEEHDIVPGPFPPASAKKRAARRPAKKAAKKRATKRSRARAR